MQTEGQSDPNIQKNEEPRALQFITLQNGKFQISEQAEIFFENLQRQVESEPEFYGLAIISIVGKYRTGKSYFINKVLLNKKSRSKGFEVGPTVNACTKGLWLWDRLLNATDSLGRPIKVLVIDSEGLNSTEVDSNYDNRVFMFCLLLSSLFVYNSMGAIDENALQTINLILNLALKVKVKGGSARLSEAEIRNAFPDLLWVLRDAFLSQEDLKGRKLTSGEYLESALKKQSGMSMNIKNKNRIRMQIKKFFPKRDCVRFVRPVEDESKLRRLDSLDDRQLRSEFLSQVRSTRKKIFEGLKAKSYQGELLSPKLVLGLARSYLGAINEHQELNIESAWKYVIRQQANKGKIKSQELLNRLVDWVNTLLAGKEISQTKTNGLDSKLISEFLNLSQMAINGADWGEWKARVRKVIREEFRKFCIKGKGDYDAIEEQIIADAEPKLLMLEKSVSNTTKSKIRKKLRGEIDRLSVPASNAELKLPDLEKEIKIILINYVQSELHDRFFKILQRRESTDFGDISVSEALDRLVEYKENNEISAKTKFLDELLEKDLEYTKAKEYLRDKKETLVFQIMEAQKAQAKKEEEEIKRKFEERLENERQQIANQGELAQQEKERLKTKIGKLEDKVISRDQKINDLKEELRKADERVKELELKNKEDKQAKVPSSELEHWKTQAEQQRKLRETAEKKAIKAQEENKRLNIMKEMLENQVSNLQSSKRDFKGVFEDFMLKMKLDKEDSRIIESNRDVEKRLSTAVAQLTDRNSRLEEKLEKLKNFKTMVKHAASFECKLCYEQILDSEFFDHVLNCATGRSKILGRSTRASRGHSTISVSNQKTPLSRSQARFRAENSGIGVSLAEIERGFYETGEIDRQDETSKRFDQIRDGISYSRGQGFNALESRRRGSGRSARKTPGRVDHRFGDRSLRNFRNASLTRGGMRNGNIEVKPSRSIRSIRRPKLNQPEPVVSMLHQRKIEKYLQDKIIPSEVSVEIEKTRVKLENKNPKKSNGDSTFIFYEVKVFFGDLESHVIYRKLLDFCSLSKRMEASFERKGRGLEFIEDFKGTVQRMLKNRTQIESRKRILEQFLCEMVQLEAGKKSPLFFRFLGLERLSKLRRQNEGIADEEVLQNREETRGRRMSISGSYMEATGLSGVDREVHQGTTRTPNPYSGLSRASRKRLHVDDKRGYKSHKHSPHDDSIPNYIQSQNNSQSRMLMTGEDQETYARAQNRNQRLYNPNKSNKKPHSQIELETSQKWSQQYIQSERRASNHKYTKESVRKKRYPNHYDYNREQPKLENLNEQSYIHKSRRASKTKSFIVSNNNNNFDRNLYLPRGELGTEKNLNRPLRYQKNEMQESARLQEDLHSNYNTVKSRSNRMTGNLGDLGENQNNIDTEDDEKYFNRLAQKKEKVIENENILYSRFEENEIHGKDSNEQRDSQNQNFYENSESSDAETESDKELPQDPLLESKENFGVHHQAIQSQEPYYNNLPQSPNTQNFEIQGYRATLEENSVESQEKEDFEKLKESSRQLRGINSLTQKMLGSSQKSLKSGKFGSRLYHQRQRTQHQGNQY